jgi:hypothetical protein
VERRESSAGIDVVHDIKADMGQGVGPLLLIAFDVVIDSLVNCFISSVRSHA